MEVQVKKIQEEIGQNVCLLSRKVFDELKLFEENIYTIHIGMLNRQSEVKAHDDDNSTMYLSGNIFTELLPYEDQTLNIWGNSEDLYLGPVIGIFENPKILARIIRLNGWFSIRQYLKAGIGAHCLCYYFSVEGIDWKEKRISGIGYQQGTDKFQYFSFPMPDVIYDKGIFLEEELKAKAKKVRKKFKRKTDVRFINSRNSLGKWELNEALSRHEETAKFIPETTIYNDFRDIILMLDKHGFVFLKSFSGSKGKEVLSIEQKGGLFIINYYDNTAHQLKEIQMCEAKEVEDFIKKFTVEKRFIIQKGIRLLKFKESRMDLRVLLEKDEKGMWKVIFNAARIASNSFTITNTSIGGGVIFYNQIYPEFCTFSEGIKVPDEDEINRTAVEVASYIEKEFGTFGEIGMDLAIDIDGRIWILEANAKPDKCMDIKFSDINGDIFITQVLGKKKPDRKFVKMLINGDILLPQASAIFKYAKYMTIE